MSPSESKDIKKKTGVPPQPLCLFCFPDEITGSARNSYVDTLSKNPAFTFERERVRGFTQKVEDTKNKDREEFWLRKRTEDRIRRRRMKEPVRNLKTYLLTSEKNEKVRQKRNLPSLIEVLEIVKDAWPSPSSRKKSLLGQEQKLFRLQCQKSKPKMKDEEVGFQFSPQLLHRRLSMPEELMRRFSISRERTSEESETNKTAIELSPSSSSIETTETVRKVTKRETQQEIKHGTRLVDAYQQTSDSEQPKTVESSKRVSQYDYYNQGKRIIKIKVEKGCTCRKEEPGSTPWSGKEDTYDSGTSDSLPSSSPTLLPKKESSSGNLSSDSDHLRCTCAELTSTSTDFFRSGKSTLSQTVSDKSVSTQDSTVSINSVSTRGSTISDNSDSTTPEKTTNAKETTTSPEYSPRTPKNRRNRMWHHSHKKTCPRYLKVEGAKCRKLCLLHSEYRSSNTVNTATNTDEPFTTDTKKEIKLSEKIETQVKPPEEQVERYRWTKLSEEELYMMQQLRHRRFVESQKQLFHSLLPTPDDHARSTCESNIIQTEYLDELIMIPRYSALPRTLSMLVNTSSPDTSHCSDSDNQSLADSLEDQPTTHVHKLYFDTKKESKPVRGDASVLSDSKGKSRQVTKPRGRAFFISIKNPYGEGEMLESIEKIPQPPEKIKNQIFKRHLNLCSKHKRVHEDKPKQCGGGVRKRKEKNTEEGTQNKKSEGKKFFRKGENKSKGETKSNRDKARSKIPVLVSSQSTSSSPEGEPKDKLTRPKIRLRREKQPEEFINIKQSETETTEILEIAQTKPELILPKPQAVIHPSVDRKADQNVPPLASTLKIPPFRQFNKQFLLPARRSPTGKFRQRFEVIPEEKSSSLSSAEEKNSRKVLPKFTDASTSPVTSAKIPVQNCNLNDVSNLIVANFTNKELESLPYLNTDGQKIFLFSKSRNSTKGRDALIAMNRQDFNRLAKGWINFYKLNDCADNSDNENKKPRPEENEKKPKEPELEEPVRLHSSNTILKAKSLPSNSGRNANTQKSLPDLEPSSEGGCARGSTKNCCNYEESDSDSTDYMEPPSPRVPPLPIGDIPSDATLSSADSDFDGAKSQVATHSVKLHQFKKRTTTNRPRPRRGNSDISEFRKKKNSGWSVTVAGTVELSRSSPDLEMRLSFPVKGGLPVISQSDSGFADDSKPNETHQNLDLFSATPALTSGSGHRKDQWMVTVKNHKKGTQQSTKLPLPVLNCDRNGKKDLKDAQLEKKLKRIVEKKIWPKVKRVIREELEIGSGRIFTDDDDSALSVMGSAVSLERKQKPPTMTERDLTRRYTSRTGEKSENVKM